MEKELGKDISPERRPKFLEDNCDTVEEIVYMKRFTPDELNEMKEKLSETAIAINDVEEAKSVAMTKFKDMLKPLVKNRQKTLKGLKEKAALVTEKCYKFIHRDERMVAYYNEEGDLVNSRPATAEEMQGTLFQVLRNTGTDN